jgi:hypothetical protein
MVKVEEPVAYARAVPNKYGGFDLTVDQCPGCGKPSHNKAVADASGNPDLSNNLRTCTAAGCWQTFRIHLAEPPTGKAQRMATANTRLIHIDGKDFESHA